MNTAVDLSSIAQAYETALNNDVVTSKYIVVRSETVNGDPSLAMEGWAGIYRSACRYDPRTLGKGGGNFRASITLYIVAQVTSLQTGADAEERLEEVIGNLLRVFFNDLSIRSTVEMIEELNVTYSYNRTSEKTAYFQEALIEVKCIAHS